jgi:polyphosphate kinase 2 (PPK2 family)
VVERVEGFATEQEWMRACSEIGEFEEELLLKTARDSLKAAL